MDTVVEVDVTVGLIVLGLTVVLALVAPFVSKRRLRFCLVAAAILLLTALLFIADAATWQSWLGWLKSGYAWALLLPVAVYAIAAVASKE